MITASGGTFRVTGGNPIGGRIRPAGNKNEALPLLAAALLTEEPVTLQNVPDIEDVAIMQEIVQGLGAQIKSRDDQLEIQCSQVPANQLDPRLTARIRGSVTLAGPLLARTGRIFLPRPGGDRIGRRRMDTHILALQALGASVEVLPHGFELRARQLMGADILLDEASVTATENVVCAATLARGTTIIRHAASEPHVQGLCHMLRAMGARIEGIGSNTLTVEGVDRLHGAIHRIGPDYLESGSFLCLAAVTGGELTIENAGRDALRMIRLQLRRLGVVAEDRGEDDLFVPGRQELRIADDLGGAVPTLDDSPWPGFPADMTSVALVTATQSAGTVIIHEKMFESRLFFVDRLISMGARIVLCDPHRAVVIGKSPLYGSTVSSPDIRAGMAMLIATLCAEGESEIHNVSQIDRGFSRIDERLRSLGAKIERFP